MATDVTGQLNELFDHRVPDRATARTHEAVRVLFKGTAAAVVAILPALSPERTRAIRLLADAMREVNYAVSIGQAANPEEIASGLDQMVTDMETKYA